MIRYKGIEWGGFNSQGSRCGGNGSNSRNGSIQGRVGHAGVGWGGSCRAWV